MFNSVVRLKPAINVFFDDNNNTVFLSPNKELVVKGINEVVPKLVPLLNGSHSANEIISLLNEFSENSLLELLALLKSEGFVDKSVLPPVSKFFHEFSSWGHYNAPFLTDEEVFNLTYKAQHKIYEGAEKIHLPKRLNRINKSFDNLIKSRRSVRRYSQLAMGERELSTLLYYAYGVTEIGSLDHNAPHKNGTDQKPLKNEPLTFRRRTVPSAGALYPIEIYVVVFNVTGMENAVYHYAPSGHFLEKVRVGDFRSELEESFIAEGLVSSSSTLLIMTSVFNRNQVKYGERGYRYILFEAGHIAQNVYLCCSAMGLGVVAIGGFNDDLLNNFLEIDGEEEAAIYNLVLGKA